MSRSTKPKPANLTINAKRSNEPEFSQPLPQPSPMLNLEGIDLSSFGGDFSAGLINLPPLPQSPPASPRVDRETSSITHLPTFKSRITSEQDQRAEPPARRPAKDDDEYRPNSSSMSKIYHLRKNPGSTPELSLVGSAENVRKHSEDAIHVQSSDARYQQSSPQPPEDSASTRRKDRGFRNPLARNKSIRRESNSKSKPSMQQSEFEQPPKTAPLQSDWHGSSDFLLRPKGNVKRGKSAERAAAASESEDHLTMDRQQKDRGAAFVAGSKNVMNKAKTGGGHLLNRLGKIGRTGSNHGKEIPDSEYVLQVINLPLVEQARITRISKNLSNCRDKTEYWMPSLPWRCIDYLNLNCESEGLYRVPGSGPQVKHWQRRFDTELDVDLLDEKELYDPNIISSMLKSWLRELPSEIFPKAQQQALGEELFRMNPNYQKLGEPVPQKLRDALSELPPFNYYLLFAITCHLSLLLNHKEKNKMDLNNLSICIGPCLDLERWLFNYLIAEWRACWQGCNTEKQYLEIEKAFEYGSGYEPPVSQDNLSEKRTDSESQSTFASDSIASNGYGTSPQGSQEHDRVAKNGFAASRRGENFRSDPSLNSLPDYSNYVNGTVRTIERKPVYAQDEKRPHTARGEEVSEIGSTRPLRLSTHSRSHSDLPVSPAGQPAPLDFPFKIRNE